MTTTGRETRILTRSETRAVLDLQEMTTALRDALARAATDGLRRERIPFDVPPGSFHLVTGAVGTDQGARFVTKVNGWFPAGVTGFTALCDAADGSVLAFMDSAALTQMRTAALAAVAAGALAVPGADTLGLLGAGRQSYLQAPAVRLTTQVRRVLVWDPIDEARRNLVEHLRELGFEAQAAASAEDCAARSGIIVSIVPSTTPILDQHAVREGTLVIALGADAPGKREHETALLQRATIVTDVTVLCARYGELQHPIAEGVLGPDAVQAELGQILAGERLGRTSDRDIVVFDSTGSAVQDAVAASLIERNAAARNVGTPIDLRV